MRRNQPIDIVLRGVVMKGIMMKVIGAEEAT